MNRILLVTLLLIETVSSINIVREKPIFKVLLKQRGSPQYLRYDLRTATLREFTICTWLRFVDLEDDQTVFSYVSKANKLIISIWVEAGGANMRIYLDGKTSSNIPVSFNNNDWRHICLSYQSDYGAWALYVDTQLVSCEQSHMLSESYFPGDGSVLIGHRGINGTNTGIQAEVFGVNMILISTIDRKFKTMNIYRRFPEHIELQSLKDTETKDNYVILSQKQRVSKMMDGGQVHPTNYQILDQPNTYSTKGLNNTYDFNEHEILDFSLDIQPPPAMSKNFWEIVNKAGHEGKFKKDSTVQIMPLDSDLPLISSIEVPPPPAKPNDGFFFNSKTFSHNKIGFFTSGDLMSTKNNRDIIAIPEIETPPPLDKNPKVYGHWTGSNFAGKVLDYLKSVNFKESRKKHVSRVPPTIPLTKTSDSFPYPTDFRATFVLKPKHFERRNDFILRSNKVKRHSSTRQINVQIISENRENVREKILKFHALTKPVHVEVTNRGEIKNDIEFHDNIDSTDNEDSASYHSSTNQVKAEQGGISDKASLNKTSTFIVNDMIKSNDYVIDGKDDSDFDVYYKRILTGNKLRSNNLDVSYVPQVREEKEKNGYFNENYSDTNRRFQTVKLNHNYNITLNDEWPTSHTGQANVIKHFENKMDLFPTTNNNIISNIRKPTPKLSNSVMILDKEDNFHKPVKIGNTLNERRVIGDSVEEKQRSFVGGDEQVPDIHRYRSDIDDEISKDVPPSLGARMCLTTDKHIGTLLVKLDGSIGAKLTDDIMSQTKNIAIQFILMVYRQCSVKGFVLEHDRALIIDWLVTPVQLLGGAYPQRLHSVCSFKY